MTQKAIHLLGSRAVFNIMLLWLLTLAGFHYWPASYWLEVDKVLVAPARALQPVPMLVERRVNTPFTGTWTVSIRRWEATGWVAFCTASGAGNYSGKGDLPKNLTLAWWTNNQCPTLPEGRYVMSTAWTIQVPGLPPDKGLQVDSNIFEITQ